MSRSRNDTTISVVMPVYNALPFLDEAIQSILDQTRRDFEFVIYDDGSTDGSAERLEEWAAFDARIKLFRGKYNLGPAASSNEVVKYASAPIIARMDADDISLPERLQRQAAVLDENPDVGLVACVCDVIDPHGCQIRGPDLWRLQRKSWSAPFPHGSTMFRRELFDAIGGYREECAFWEDLDLVIRASARARILVVPYALYRYRQSTSSTRIASDQSRVERALDLRYRSIDRIRLNQSYDDLLRQGPKDLTHRIDPRVFLSLGLLALWSEQRPSLMRRFIRRAQLGFDASTVTAIVGLTLSRICPGAVRSALNLLFRVRNAAVKSKHVSKEPIQWHPPNSADAA